MPAKAGLLAHLLENFSKDYSRTEIKRLLKFGRVRVNGAVQTRHDAPIKKDDRVEILGAPKGGKNAVEILSEYPAIRLVYEDEAVLVVEKPADLLTVATEKIKEKTLYYRLNEYLKLKRRRVFIVHRLDREVSGILVFAKNEAAKHFLQDDWENTEKKYYAVVEGALHPLEGEFESYLSQNKGLKVFSVERPSHSAGQSRRMTGRSGESKLAITRYKVLRNNRRNSLLEISIPTGRKHQIRVHLSEAGHPVIGDEKYGSSVDPLRRLALHAEFLSFTHPVSGKRMSFQTELPEGFLGLVS